MRLTILLAAAACTAFAQAAPPLASLDDWRRFDSVPVAPAASPRELARADGSVKLPRAMDIGGVERSFDDVLRESGTVAWIVLRDGRIADERYYDGYARDSIVPSFSVAKSAVGALAAIAIARGEVNPAAGITDTLPALADADRGWRRVTWQHLIDMRSAADFDEAYDRDDSDVARLYAGTQLAAQALAVGIDGAPGRRFAYDSINTQLLAMALERATGLSIAEQLAQRLWQPLGAEAAATWSTDGAAPPTVKAFCCLNARALDFARFGQLIADRGEVDGRAVLPAAWVDGLLAAARRGEPYAGQWWLLHDPKSGADATALLAQGVLGQFVFVHPGERLVIARFGRGEGEVPWRALFGAIVAANRAEAPTAAAAE